MKKTDCIENFTCMEALQKYQTLSESELPNASKKIINTYLKGEQEVNISERVREKVMNAPVSREMFDPLLKAVKRTIKMDTYLKFKSSEEYHIFLTGLTFLITSYWRNCT